MLDQLWTDVDRALCEWLVPEDPSLAAVARSIETEGLPAIQVAPNQGKLLQLLARAIGARRILEIGTHAGYSTLWLARALPGDAPPGSLVTLEIDPHRAALARTNLDRASVGATVAIRVGDALDSLDRLRAEGVAPFDFVFVDADKQRLAAYLDRCVRLCRPGATIVVDNVVRSGRILDGDSDDASVIGVRRMFDAVAADLRLAATAVQTVGSKGHDGFLLAVVGA